MNKEEMIEDFINYLNRDIQSKDFLTYREQDEWKDYINRIINNQVKEKDKEIQKLNNIINELEKDIQKEIDRTNDLILEDSSMVEINNIRRMLNETRQCILFRIKELKEGK